MRAPPHAHGGGREGRLAQRQARAAPDGPHRPVPVGGAGRHHDGVHRARFPRRAGGRHAAGADLRRGDGPRRLGRDLGRDRLCARDVCARDRRRAGAEDDGDHPRRANRPLVRASPGVVPARTASRDLGAERRLQLRRQEDPADRGRERQRGCDRRGAACSDRAWRALRGARPERGRHARGRVPPARAGGPPGDDADPGAGHREQRRHRRDRRCAGASHPVTRDWS